MTTEVEPDRDEQAVRRHRDLRGKVGTEVKTELDAEALELLYTPGVGAVASLLAEHPEEASELTRIANTVAVVSDGTAVLELGDVGPVASLPVLEGKALLFKALAGVDAIALPLHGDTETCIAAIKAIAPGFGAINLEDFSSPECYEIEARLQRELDIPVVHDDQHATAIAVLAGLLNALRVVGKDPEDVKVVVVGGGASGGATVRLLAARGVGELVATDARGVLSTDRDDLDDVKRGLAELTGRDRGGELDDVVPGADAVIGLAVEGAIRADHVRAMADRPIVLALANPDPEITPQDAREAGAAVVATGRSDHPNQVNNVLVFPGLFRGLLDARARTLDDVGKVAAAEALAALVEEPRAGEILPSALDDRVVPAVARAVREACTS